MTGYPRDLRGYGRTPPDPKWPNGARLAVQFVINYEEGGENCILHGDAGAEAYLSEIVGAAPLVGARNLNMESMYEYGTRVGFWRLHRLFTERALPVTVFAVGMAVARYPEAATAMAEAGWEVASHGWRWIDYHDVDEATERDHLARVMDAIEQAAGVRPVGWYTGRISPHTRRLLVEHGGFLYDADSYADELPYWNHDHGRPHLIVPYTLDANDFRFAMPQGFNSGDQFLAYLTDSFDQLYEESAERPRMLSVGLHCRIAGRPGRARALARFLDHVLRHDDVWVCRRDAIARHWHDHHPPEARP